LACPNPNTPVDGDSARQIVVKLDDSEVVGMPMTPTMLESAVATRRNADFIPVNFGKRICVSV
jgi:hypothetical protein